MATKTKSPKTTATLESLLEQPVLPPTDTGSTAVNSSPSNPTPEGQPERLQPETLAPELMSVKAAAERLGLSLSSISHHVKQGHIKAVTVGTASILLRWSVDDFEQSRQTEQRATEEERKLKAQLKALKEKRLGTKAK